MQFREGVLTKKWQERIGNVIYYIFDERVQLVWLIWNHRNRMNRVVKQSSCMRKCLSTIYTRLHASVGSVDIRIYSKDSFKFTLMMSHTLHHKIELRRKKIPLKILWDIYFLFEDDGLLPHCQHYEIFVLNIWDSEHFARKNTHLLNPQTISRTLYSVTNNVQLYQLYTTWNVILWYLKFMT